VDLTAHCREHTSGMTRVLKESHSFTCSPCIHLLTDLEWWKA